MSVYLAVALDLERIARRPLAVRRRVLLELAARFREMAEADEGHQARRAA